MPSLDLPVEIVAKANGIFKNLESRFDEIGEQLNFRERIADIGQVFVDATLEFKNVTSETAELLGSLESLRGRKQTLQDEELAVGERVKTLQDAEFRLIGRIQTLKEEAKIKETALSIEHKELETLRALREQDLEKFELERKEFQDRITELEKAAGKGEKACRLLELTRVELNKKGSQLIECNDRITELEKAAGKGEKACRLLELTRVELNKKGSQLIECNDRITELEKAAGREKAARRLLEQTTVELTECNDQIPELEKAAGREKEARQLLEQTRVKLNEMETKLAKVEGELKELRGDADNQGRLSSVGVSQGSR